MQITAPDVLIIGGGVVGCATAYYLAAAGYSVTMVERDAIASHASGFAYGGLVPVMGLIVDDPVLPLSDASARLHAELAGKLPDESGVDYEYCAKPSLAVALDRSERSGLEAAHRWLSEHHEGETRWLEGDALHEIEPRLSGDVVAGLLTDRASELEPYRFCLALWQAAEKRGARMVNSTVAGFSKSRNRVQGVALTTGETIYAGSTILAAGPWSGELAGELGAGVPIRPLKGQILRLKAAGEPISHSISWSQGYATTKPDGLVWAGTTIEEAGFDERTTTEGRDKITRSLVRVLPYLQDAKLARQTACLRPVVEDDLPVLGPAPGVEGAYMATGGGRNGILLAPGMARAVSDMAQGIAPEFDVEPLSPARFATAQ
ncbi:MAG: NAD(P)/FAD-dependent oxidoreductase [Chloroflexota bacterium]